MKKLTLVLLLCLMSSQIIMAQESFNEPIAAGESRVVDLSHSDIGEHESLGVFISEVNNVFKRYISYNGEDIFKNESTSKLDFVMNVFPAGSTPSNTVMGELFQSTESVSIRGTDLNIWDTYSLTAMDTQELSSFNDVMNFDDGTTLKITTFDNAGEFIDFELNGVALHESGVVPQGIFTQWLFPTHEEVISYFGLNPAFNDADAQNRFRAKIVNSNPDVTFDNKSVIFFVCDEVNYADCSMGDNWNYFIESDRDYTSFEFSMMINGYSVSSFETQAAIIIPAGIYDIYGSVS